MLRGSEFVDAAPVGILRAAAWPIEALSGFGSDDLARLALDVGDLSGRTLNEAYISAWRRTIERERQLLWRSTAGDPRFLKAVLFSNPSLYRRVQRYACRRDGPRTKPMRRLESTLYRYLARAVGRPTPMGLWAGVSPVTFSAGSRQQETPARFAVAPDLRPFQTMLRNLSTRGYYSKRVAWRLNPTLHADGRGWTFWARLPDGRIEGRRMDYEARVGSLLGALSDGFRGTLAELRERVTRSVNRQGNAAACATDAVERLLESLAAGGALVGGLDLPSRFSSPWEALDIAQGRLTERDRRHWSAALVELRAICAAISGGLESAPADEVARLISAARAAVEGLAEALEADLPAIDYPILRCDLGLPMKVSCDTLQLRRLLEAVRSYESCWVEGTSPWTLWRRARSAERLSRLKPGMRLGSLEAGVPDPADWQAFETADPGFRSRLEAWQEVICTDADDVVLEPGRGGSPPGLPASPLGCLYVGLHEGFELHLHGLSDHVATSFARYGNALGSIEPLTAWLSRCLGGLEAKHGIAIAELAGPFERSPNALARPTVARRFIDPWGADPDTEALAGAEIRLEPCTRLPFLWRSSDSRPTAVFSFSSANIASADPVARRLLETSFGEAPSGRFRALDLPVRREVERPRFSARVRLPCGSVIRSRRTVIGEARLRQLAKLSPWQRYVHWQHLAVEYGWPELLRVSLSGRAPLVMKRTSPLALDALFKGLRNCRDEDHLIVEELIGVPWLKDANGRSYVAELALPFARQEHGWSALHAATEREEGGPNP